MIFCPSSIPLSILISLLISYEGVLGLHHRPSRPSILIQDLFLVWDFFGTTIVELIESAFYWDLQIFGRWSSLEMLGSKSMTEKGSQILWSFGI